jgi:hypothetical protein
MSLYQNRFDSVRLKAHDSIHNASMFVIWNASLANECARPENPKSWDGWEWDSRCETCFLGFTLWEKERIILR